MHKFDAAKECYEDYAELQRESQCSNIVSIGSTLHKLGCLLVKMSDRDKALEHLKSSLKIRKKELGLHNLDTISTILRIGEIYFSRGENDAAFRCFDQARPLLIEINGPDDVDLAVCNEILGTIHCKNEKFKDAAVFLQEALQIHLKMKSGTVKQMSQLYHNLGHALCNTGEHREATEYLAKGENH